MGNFKNLTGMKFGRLTVVKRGEDYITPKGKKIIRWLCECDCQKNIPEEDKSLILVRGSDLRSGNTKSCGCLHKEFMDTHNKSFKKYNTYNLNGEYGVGYTSKNEPFYFDLEDYDKIKDYCWYKNSQGYIRTNIPSINGQDALFIHDIIMDIKKESLLMADHIHGKESRHDNRKSNLRIVTSSQNNMNVPLREDNTSGYTGVHFSKDDGLWCARIQIENKRIYLGKFSTKEEAVRIRKEAEEKYFGEYSYDNSQKT